MILVITFVCAFFILNDLVPIYKSKQWRAFWAYSVMLALVYILALLTAAGVKIPSPAAPLKRMVSAIWGL